MGSAEFVPKSWLVDPPLDNGAEGIQGPESLPPESDLDELSEPDDDGPEDMSGDGPNILGGRCASARVGEQQM